MSKKLKKTNFEDDITKLAGIVEQIEDNQTPLDVAISLYKEGTALATKCGEILSQYEEEIHLLQQNADNTFILKRFGDL